jgi:signal transduction histidine kinase
MKIRAKLTLTFFLLVIVVLTTISVAIYYFSSNYREVDFYRRLRNRAINTARVLKDVKEVNAELLRRMEKNNPASLPNQYIVIYNEKDEELYRSMGPGVIENDHAILNSIRQQKNLRFHYNNYEVLGFEFNEQPETLTILAAATDVYGLDALKNLRNILIITFCISIVFVSILGWVYAGKVLKPISQIVQEVGNITEANLDQRLDEGNQKDELSQLARTFNLMLGRLQGSFASQKNFIANASHEIKTPLTVMSGEIEVTLLQERNKEYYVNVLRSVLTGLRGLNSLSTQLLVLAQTSADQPSKNFKALRVDDTLWDIKDEFMKIHNNYIINILFDINLNHESLVIHGDEQLIKIALSNLTDNACKYSDNHEVTINLKSTAPGNIAIEFVNSGPGIAPTELQKIFAPFFRGKNHNKVKGFGIGLSLVHRIAKLHRGDVAVSSAEGRQTSFTITFPLNPIQS